MSDKIKARHIVERWHTSIKKEDKKSAEMGRIFDDVASQLFAAGIGFDVAHDSIVESGKLMYPPFELIKYVWQKSTMNKKLTVLEFAKSWQESLNKSALEAFYTYYEIEGTNVKKLPKPKGPKTEDELNEDDFWKSVKSVSRDNPWLFDEDHK